MSAQTLPQDSSCGIGGRLSDVDVLLSNVTYRPLVPSDQKKLKRMHDELLPVDYNQDFFDRACSQSRGILGYAAVLPADEELVGFVTVCDLAAHEIATADRRLLGLSGDENDDVRVMYILTLGVCKVRAIISFLKLKIDPPKSRPVCSIFASHTAVRGLPNPCCVLSRPKPLRKAASTFIYM